MGSLKAASGSIGTSWGRALRKEEKELSRLNMSWSGKGSKSGGGELPVANPSTDGGMVWGRSCFGDTGGGLRLAPVAVAEGLREKFAGKVMLAMVGRTTAP